MGWLVLPFGQIAIGHRLEPGHVCKCGEAPVNPGRAGGARGSAFAFQTLMGRVNDVIHLGKETCLLSTSASSSIKPPRHFKVPTRCLSLSFSLSLSLSSFPSPYFFLLPPELIWSHRPLQGIVNTRTGVEVTKGSWSAGSLLCVCMCMRVCVCFLIIPHSRNHNRSILWDVHMFRGIELSGVFAVFVCLDMR